MSVPHPLLLNSNHMPALLQLKHSLVTENLVLFGHVKVAFVPAAVICHINLVPKNVRLCAGQNPGAEGVNFITTWHKEIQV